MINEGMPFTLERQRRKIDRDCAALGLPKTQTAKIKNTFDLLAAIELLMHLKPRVGAAAPLLSRVINALHDVSVGAKPALFDIESRIAQSLLIGKRDALLDPTSKPTGYTIGAAAEGSIALVAELLFSVMPRPEALAWLDREIVACSLLDREGNPVAASRILDCRKNFRRRQGAALGRQIYSLGREHHHALIRAPKSDLKRRRVEETARAILSALAASARGEIAVPQHRTT